MSDFVTVCDLAELKDLQPKAAIVRGTSVVVVRVGDEIHAVADSCSHAEIPLSEGAVEPTGKISCWLHGSRFDLNTGEPEELPAWEPIDVYTTALIEEAGKQRVAVSLSPPNERES